MLSTVALELSAESVERCWRIGRVVVLVLCSDGGDAIFLVVKR